MAVVATYCGICSAPVQQDHYVRTENSQMLQINRGGSSSMVSFGPEHDWLVNAVGLRLNSEQQPSLIRGRVHDGSFEDEKGRPLPDGYVFWGLEERSSVHEACWELAGQPDVWDPASVVARDKSLDRYAEQLFDFPAVIRDGLGWMLVDPKLDSEDGRRNRARILAVLKRQ